MTRTERIPPRFASLATGLALASLPCLALPAAAQPTDFLFSTYLGGNSYDVGADVVVDPNGYAYAVGTTAGDGFPGAGAPPEPEPEDAPSPTSGFLAIFNGGGSLATSSAYLGGGRDETIRAAAISGWDVWSAGTVAGEDGDRALLFRGETSVPLPDALRSAVDVAVDGAGHVYLTGAHESAAAYVTKLSPAGDPIYLALLPTAPQAIAVDRTGFVYLLDAADGLTKLDPAGNPVPYSPALAAGVTDLADIAVDPAGNLHLAGTAHGLYYASFTPSGAALASRVIPGASGTKIALGPAGTVGLLGRGAGPGFPLVRPLPVTCPNGCPSVIVTMVGTTIVTSSVFPYRTAPDSLAFGPGGELFVVGTSSDANLPVVNAIQPEQNAELDAYLFAFAPPGLPPVCHAATAQPAVLWPDNHTLRPIAIQGVTDPEGGAVALRVTAIRQDEPTTQHYRPDGTGIGTASPRVRAARDRKRNGRVYTISFEAADPLGAACRGAVKVCVPLVEGGTCIDDGPAFDSTSDTTPFG